MDDARAPFKTRMVVSLCCATQGFEMNPEEWIPLSNIKDNVELDKWESKLGGDEQ